MIQWDIRVLCLGKIKANQSLIWPNGMPPQQDDPELIAPYLGFLLQSQSRNILVDSGIWENSIAGGMASPWPPASV